MPSVPPIMMARSARGSLISRTMMVALPRSVMSALAAVHGVIGAGPIARDATASRAVTDARRATTQPPRPPAPLTAMQSPRGAHAAVERAPGGAVVLHLLVTRVGQVFGAAINAER